MASLLLFSCKKVLDDANIQTNTATDQWTSTTDLEKLVAGAYYGISGYSGNTGIHGAQFTNEAMLSDQAYLHANAVTGSFEQDLYNRVNTRNDMSIHASIWTGSYQGIALCNEIINWIDKNGAFKDQNGPYWTNRILGEALFLRAFIYFTIVRIYGPAYGATAANETKAVLLKVNKGLENLSRSSVKDTYDLILSDLARAVSLLPAAYRPNIDPQEYQDRADRMSARFLLARVYFQMKDFDNAKIQCDSVLNSGRFPLTEDPIQAWNKTGLASKGKEVVWQYTQYSSSQQQWKSSPAGLYLGFTSQGSNSISTGSGSRILAASDYFLKQVGWDTTTFTLSATTPIKTNIVDSFSIISTDKRLSQLWKAIPGGYDPKTEYAGYTRTYVWCNKWNRITVVNNSLYSLPFMRSAELYLTRAIILFRKGDLNGAAADLNVVRQRAGIPAITAATITEDLIHQERMKELAFEGDRLYYLQAVGLAIPAGDRVGVTPVDWKSTTFAMPVPSTETSVNPNAGN